MSDIKIHRRKGDGRVTINCRIGDYIMIGDAIVVKLARLRSKQIRVAVIAPKDLAILRGDLWAGKHPEGIWTAGDHITLSPGQNTDILAREVDTLRHENEQLADRVKRLERQLKIAQQRGGVA